MVYITDSGERFKIKEGEMMGLLRLLGLLFAHLHFRILRGLGECSALQIQVYKI